MLRDFLNNLSAGLLSELLIFQFGLRWARIRAFVGLDNLRLRTLFGKKTVEEGVIAVVLDTWRDLRRV